MHRDYYPTKTLNAFHQCNDQVRVVVGPLGSGKTFAMIMECLRRAMEQQADAFGVRRTRCAIVRQTRPQIISTIMPEIQQAIGPLIDYRPSKSAVYFNLALADGTQVESEWLLMPLQEEADQRRLLSLNLTWIWVSELRELNYELVQAIRGRAGRYPAMAAPSAPPTWHGLFGETNPWSITSPWHTNLVTDRPHGWSLFRQPGGLERDAENLQHLFGGAEYYENLMRGASQEWIDVHVHAKWGADKAGTPVYQTTYNPSFHTSQEPLTVNPALPLYILQDFGRTPAALIAQVTADTRLVVYAETTGDNMGIEYFSQIQLLPLLKTSRFADHPYTVIADPAGGFGEQGTEETLYMIMERLGFTVHPAPTSEVEPRIRATEAALMQQRNGLPVIHIDGVNCPLLAQAMEYSYKYGRNKEGQLMTKPSKTHPWSDLADALGYGVLFIFGSQYTFEGARAHRKGKRGKPLSHNPPFSAAAWT